MKLSRLTLPALCLLMSSCVYSLFPIYTADTITYIPELNGRWVGEDGQTVTFEGASQVELRSITVKSDDPTDSVEQIAQKSFKEIKEIIAESNNSYKMTIEDEDVLFTYRAHLVEIGDDLFIDLYPWLEKDEAGTTSITNRMPVHTFMKLNLDGGNMSITHFNLSKLKDLFKSNLIRIRHEMVDGEVLITAQTEDIQKFLEKYSQDPSVYDDTNNYTRAI